MEPAVELTILVLIIMAAALILMPAHFYAPDEKPDRPSIPPDLIQGGARRLTTHSARRR